MNVPQLRFDGFDGEWKVKKINKIAEISSGGTPSRKKAEYWNGNIPWVTTSEVKFNNILGAKEYISDLGLKESSAKLFPPNTILIAMYGQGQTRGKSAMLKIEAATNQACAAIKVKDVYESQFIYHMLSYKYNELRELSNDGSQKNLSLGLLNSFRLKIPSLKEEQTKIASFITVLNVRIEKQQEKIEKLEQFKKGMMQKIFSRELRFKDEDGGEFEKWKESTFGEIITTFSGGTPLSSNPKYYNGEIPFIRSGEIYTDKTELFITEEGLQNSSAKMVNEGDLLLALYGATSGEIAVSKINGAINQAILCIRSKQHISFIMYYWEYKKENILKTYLQGGQGNISASIVKSIDISIPIIEEQLKIGSFFGDIVKKVDKEKEKLMVLKEQKKGFMQEMFV